ncbi:DUF6069 family protein [Brachybacterium sp. AOP43-C2-M15]|uniref:DUF6069 family protein n=1 Tax=Brachybacterium sp. AOP43-C2-M15 TaxID=3457661 RepID=UPI004033EE32
MFARKSPAVEGGSLRPPTEFSSCAGLIWWQAALLGAFVTLVVNLVIWSVARAAGVQFSLYYEDGVPYPIAGDSVAVMSVVPMFVGIAVVALIARWWTWILRVAQVVGASLAVVTIGGVFSGDAGTAIALASMHLVSAAVVVLALEAMRRCALTRRHD